MPEYAEVKCNGDYIRELITNNLFVENIHNASFSKVKEINTDFEDWIWILKGSETRGKELCMTFYRAGVTVPIIKKLYFGLGMSGWFITAHKDYIENTDSIKKHLVFSLDFSIDNILALHDERRFAKWKISDNWSINRSPDPVDEYYLFCNNIKTKQSKIRKPLCVTLLDQSLFNGVGNYLRSEILYRLDIDPFTPFKDLNDTQLNDIMATTKECCIITYNLLKESNEALGQWIKCYGKKNELEIANRTFWYDKKWTDSAIAWIEKKQTN